MSKIYIVQSSCGEYEDYRIWNEKAFTSKEKAEQYAKELDEKHNSRPSFITDEFIEAYNEVYDEIPDFEEYNSDKETYFEWHKRLRLHDDYHMVKGLISRGFEVSIKMLRDFEEWESNSYDEWSPCNIDEIDFE